MGRMNEKVLIVEDGFSNIRGVLRHPLHTLALAKAAGLPGGTCLMSCIAKLSIQDGRRWRL